MQHRDVPIEQLFCHGAYRCPLSGAKRTSDIRWLSAIPVLLVRMRQAGFRLQTPPPIRGCCHQIRVETNHGSFFPHNLSYLQYLVASEQTRPSNLRNSPAQNVQAGSPSVTSVFRLVQSDGDLWPPNLSADVSAAP